MPLCPTARALLPVCMRTCQVSWCEQAELLLQC